MVRIMLKCRTVESAKAQLEYLKSFIDVAKQLQGQQLSGKNNLGNYTVKIDKDSK
jgi:hypothetical protein